MSDEAKTEEKAAAKKTKSKSKGKTAAPKKGDAKKAPAKEKGKKAAAKKAPAKKGASKKTEAKKAAPKKAPVERDQFGFRKGTKKSEAAKLYASKKGATLQEVKEKIGSSQLNLLKELDGKFKVEKTKQERKDQKSVTRYRIVVPSK